MIDGTVDGKTKFLNGMLGFDFFSSTALFINYNVLYQLVHVLG